MQLNFDANIGGSEQVISLNDAQMGSLKKMITKEVNGVLLQTFHQVTGGPQNSGAGSSGSEQDCNSDYALNGVDLRKMIEVIVIQIIRREIGGGLVENLMRKVVKEEIQSALEKALIGGDRNSEHEIGMSAERILQFEFQDEVSDKVLTGKEIKGQDHSPIKVALVDPTTGFVVKTGPEASEKVEILVLDSSSDDNEQEFSVEDFNNRIITESDTKRPHFRKRKYLHLKEGVAVLHNVKLAHDSGWMKICQCRLGARTVKNFRGIKVKEAWTKPFKVLDSRGKLYEKHYPPSLSDDVWRLVNIGKDGAPYKRLTKKNISTVQDFLFLLNIDSCELQKIVRAGSMMWKATVDHARTCIIDDNKIYIHCPSSSELQHAVIFDVVGQLNGIIQDSHYVKVTNLSEDEKVCAHKFLQSAFLNKKDIISFDDETSLLCRFPYKSSGYDRTASCYSMNPSFGSNNFLHDCSPDATYMQQQICGLNLGDRNEGMSSSFTDVDIREYDIDRPLFNSDCNNLSETLGVGSHSHQQIKIRSIVGAVAVMLWVFRARKRAKPLEDIPIPKRQKAG